MIYLTSLLSYAQSQGRVSGILDTVPVFAVLVEDLGQRGAYRVGYQQFFHMLPDLTHVAEEQCCGSDVSSPACQKRNRLLLITGVLTTLFLLGSKVNHCK